METEQAVGHGIIKMEKIDNTGMYENGSIEGTWVWYYEDGKKDYESNYEDDDLNGEAISYSRKGNIMYKMYYRDNVLISYTYLDKNGEFVEKNSCEK